MTQNSYPDFVRALKRVFDFVRAEQQSKLANGWTKTTALHLEPEDEKIEGASDVLYLLRRIERIFRGKDFKIVSLRHDDNGELWIPEYFLAPMLNCLRALIRGREENHQFATPWLNRLLALPAFNVPWAYITVLENYAKELRREQEAVLAVSPKGKELELNPIIRVKLSQYGLTYQTGLISGLTREQELGEESVGLRLKGSNTLRDEAREVLELRGRLASTVRDSIASKLRDDTTMLRANAYVAERKAAQAIIVKMRSALTEKELRIIQNNSALFKRGFGVL